MDFKQTGDAIVAAIPRRIDANSADQVQEALIGVVRDGATAVVCDLSQTDYVSSAGLRALLATAKALHAENGKFALFGVADHVQEIFEIAGFLSILPVYGAEADAIAAVT